MIRFIILVIAVMFSIAIGYITIVVIVVSILESDYDLIRAISFVTCWVY
ncbi:hypothetical protein [Aliarcobacter cryaerophilus]|nr:hypothetical protein [Aliarcobacter cryaerophilus]